MTVDSVKKFLDKYKDFVIQIRCDNEHFIYENTPGIAPIIWNWDDETLEFIEPNDELIDQSGHPMQIHLLNICDIQELTAFVDTQTALEFINENITDEEKNKEIKSVLQKVKPAMMTPRTLRKPYR